jgi:hypothetical protein
LLLHAAAFALYLGGIFLGGLDPGPDAVAFLILAYLAAVSGMLTGVLGLLQRSQPWRSASAVALGLAWIAGVTGPFWRV